MDQFLSSFQFICIIIVYAQNSEVGRGKGHHNLEIKNAVISDSPPRLVQPHPYPKQKRLPGCSAVSSLLPSVSTVLEGQAAKEPRCSVSSVC